MKPANIVNLTLSLLLLLSVAVHPGRSAVPAESELRVEEQDNIRTIEVQGTDNMRFDVTLIEAKPGETIRIKLTTVSNLPAIAMSHNIAIVDLEVDVDAFATASMMARDSEFIAPEYEDNVIAHTAMLGGGESDTIEFQVPETPGDYPYLCTFPGHYQAGMVGTLRIAE